MHRIAAKGKTPMIIFLRNELYRDTIYAKYYIGLVQSEDDGYALLFASRGNHICYFILLATR